jgi:TRAP-type C4-dicarboxylate transport system permease small subunit
MMISLALVVVLGIGFRWAGKALVWYDEVAAAQLAWVTYYGAAYASLKGAHIGVPSIIKSFPISIRKYLFILSKIVVYGFFVLLTYYGFKIMIIISGETLTTVDIPQPLVQSVIPVGSILILISETLNLKNEYNDIMGVSK